jgi:hypothetical protein
MEFLKLFFCIYRFKGVVSVVSFEIFSIFHAKFHEILFFVKFQLEFSYYALILFFKYCSFELKDLKLV